MELRTLAEKVLFSSEVEDKLQTPDALSDQNPGVARSAPRWPARIPELRLGSEEKVSFPTMASLDDPVERGRVLHFFANHELLAMELMALALLRFPNAPASFRMGVAQTLIEEQTHMRLYMNRMTELGVAFGELPVSPFFWRCLSGMQTPTDYVVGMSLVFEQANLDFCLHFAKAMKHD